jgi:hypothetical protein
VGSDRLDYSGEVATSTGDITALKNLINSTFSTKDADMMMIDIKTIIWAHRCVGMTACAFEYKYFQRKSSPSTAYEH